VQGDMNNESVEVVALPRSS